MLKRIIPLLTLLALLAAGQAVFAQQPQYVIAMPQGWAPETYNLDETLLQDYYSPHDTAMVQVYAWAVEAGNVEEFADLMVEELVKAELPFQNQLYSRMQQTRDGAPCLVREYTGVAEGTNLQGVLLFCQHDGFMYMVLGMWDMSAPQQDQDAVRATLASFGFSGAQ